MFLSKQSEWISNDLPIRKIHDKIKTYTEKDYWEGRVPDALFEEYLQKYGYEYTPQEVLRQWLRKQV